MMTKKGTTWNKTAEGGSALDWTNFAIYAAVAFLVLAAVWKLAKKLFKFALAIAVIAALYLISTGKL